MTKIKIDDKQNFINGFLSPIGKLAENTVIKVRQGEFNSLSSSNDGTLIVNCVLPQQNELEGTIFLNIPDINKLIKVLSCIMTDNVELTFNNNNLEYRSSDVGFKYHLLADGIIDPPTVDINKIKKIDFPFRFEMNNNTINQLIKASTFTTDTNKIYFSTKDGGVYGTLTDKQRHNVDSFSQCVAEQFKGDELSKELSLSFETIRIISTMRFETLNIRINPDLNVFLFQVNMPGGGNIVIVSSGFIG
ncbi:MAG: hypothetical protein EBY39_07950 [Flavobacteriia bacterium]|nr:hypothetical protein [Flavobacteriia bacterium]